MSLVLIPKILFEASLQYAVNREACTVEHMKALREEAKSTHAGRDYFRISAYVLARKIQEWDGDIARMKERISSLEETNKFLSETISKQGAKQ